MTIHPLLPTLALATLAAACSPPTVEPGTADPLSLSVVSGDTQVGTPGTELPQPLVARVLDRRGHPVRGQLVNFVVTAGGGAVFAGSALSDRDGEVREWWTLGSSRGHRPATSWSLVKTE